MIAIVFLGAVCAAVLASVVTVSHWVGRHSEPKRPPLVVIEGGRSFRN